jgi:ribosomal protein S18 acetylase RimI-like enzyme
VNAQLATKQDIPEMRALEALWNFKNLPRDALSDTGALFVPLGQEGFNKIIHDQDSCVLVDRSNGALRGMLAACSKSLTLELWPHLQEVYAPQDSCWEDSFMYVKTVAVHPDLTGRHIASDLLSTFLQTPSVKNCSSVLAVVAVAPENRRSINLFKNVLGAREIARHFDGERRIMWGLFKSIL